MRYITVVCLLGLLVLACKPSQESNVLPILGEREVVKGDTVYHKIPDFSFINQDSQVVNNESFKDKVYVVDFFFTSCPTICPKTTREMKRIYDKYLQDDRVALLAHSIDTRHDTVGKLREYAANMEVKAPKWHLITGDKAAIFAIADDYFSVVLETEGAPGGFDHSGRLILVDKQRRIRAFCDGTDPKDVDRFMLDIDKLLLEK